MNVIEKNKKQKPLCFVEVKKKKTVLIFVNKLSINIHQGQWNGTLNKTKKKKKRNNERTHSSIGMNGQEEVQEISLLSITVVVVDRKWRFFSFLIRYKIKSINSFVDLKLARVKCSIYIFFQSSVPVTIL